MTIVLLLKLYLPAVLYWAITEAALIYDLIEVGDIKCVLYHLKTTAYFVA